MTNSPRVRAALQALLSAVEADAESEAARLGADNARLCDEVAGLRVEVSDLRAEVSRLRDVGAALAAPPCGPTAGPEDATGEFPAVFP